MTENSVDPVVIKKTQETLGKIIKKPVLTDKLLNKPPFRFIHDIVNAVIKETGFLDGLYSKIELHSENIKDRDAKIKFLQKLIDVMTIIVNTSISARPSKIVAGHEADKTNELLQLIGLAIENKLDSKQAIETIKIQGTNGKLKSTSKEKSKSNPVNEAKTSGLKKDDNKDKKSSKTQPIKNAVTKSTNNKTSTKTSARAKEVEKQHEKKVEKKAKEVVVNSGRAPIKTETPAVQNRNKNDALQELKSNSIESVPHVEINHKDEMQRNTADNGKSDDQIPENSIEMKEETQLQMNQVGVVLETNHDERKETVRLRGDGKDQPETATIELKRSSGGRRKSVVEETTPSVSERSKGSGRKVSKEDSTEISRKSSDALLDISKQQLKSPPANVPDIKRQSTFVRENTQDETLNSRPRTSLRPPSVRPASARPGAPRRRDKNVEIILQPNDQVKLAGINVKLDNIESQLEDDGENLVIVESVNTLETTNKTDAESAVLDEESQQGHLVQQILQTQKELTQLDSEGMSPNDVDVVTLQKRQSSARQMDSLRDVIQSLTRSVNPLGKLMDFLPEDIDSMHLELNMWRDSYIQASNELKKEKSFTESAIEPMKNQLGQMNANIKEYKDMIELIRAKILQNSDKIHKLLAEQ